MLLADFDYDLHLTPSVPLLDATRPYRAYWYLKQYGLPFYLGFGMSVYDCPRFDAAVSTWPNREQIDRPAFPITA